MAKKPPQEPLGCTIAILVILGLAYSLPYLFTFTVYAFPLFLGFLLMFARWGRPPAAEFIDEAQISAALHDLEGTRRTLLDEIAGLEDRGDREGVRFLKVEDRFEMRSRRGQELNEALANAKSALADVSARLQMAQDPQHRRDHAWWLSMRAWRRGRAYSLAFIAALFGFAASAAFLQMYANSHLGSDLLVWNAFPRFIRRNIEIATVFGWVLGFATLFALRRGNRIADQRESATPELYAAEVDEAIESDSSYHDVSNNAVDDPYEVLNVSPEATMAEIKAAYRLAIVKCHPDTVADRSKSIREAAEAEAQRVNAAYDAIRNEQGFN